MIDIAFSSIALSSRDSVNTWHLGVIVSDVVFRSIKVTKNQHLGIAIGALGLDLAEVIVMAPVGDDYGM